MAVDSLRATGANQLTINDNVVITGSLTASNQATIFCAGKVASSGSVLLKKGAVDFSITKRGTGTYGIIFASPHPDGANWVGMAFPSVNPNGVRTAFYDDAVNSSTEFRVYLQSASMANVDGDFCFQVLQ